MRWTFLIAQLAKNLPAMQKTLVRFLGWEDILEKGKATHSSILAWRIPWTYIVHGVAYPLLYKIDFFFFWNAVIHRQLSFMSSGRTVAFGEQ